MYPHASFIVDTCQRLFAIGDTGHVFSHDDLFGDMATAGMINDNPVGFGHTLTDGKLLLPGSDNGATVFVTVVKLDDDRLYLMTELEWAKDGARHASSARYILAVADFEALQLAAEDYAELSVLRQVWKRSLLQRRIRRPDSQRFADEIQRYSVEFVQTYPGCDIETKGPEELTRRNYHMKSVVIAIRRYHFLAMLSPDEYGVVSPRALPELLAWVEERLLTM